MKMNDELVVKFQHALSEILCKEFSYRIRSELIFKWFDKEGYEIVRKKDLTNFDEG